MSAPRKKLIEVAMPLGVISDGCQEEKNPFLKGHPRSMHLWWARRPLAACRAVLFGQLVDDPSSWPKLFPTEDAQDAERQRLFDLIGKLVLWKNSNNPAVIHAARREIALSVARNRVADGEGTERDEEVLAKSVSSEKIDAYLAEVAPPVHDPFAGGGSIPLEAQRLGLRAIATDLNPVAVLINKALIEIPPKFAGRPPVHPNAEKRTEWKGAEGLAEDVRRYGEWMRDEAQKRIGHLYPEVDLPEEHGGGKATVIAWLWARTVESPNPAFRGVHVPLVRSFMLSTKKGKRAWVEPVFSKDRRSYTFEIRTGSGGPEIEGTVTRQGGTCLASGDPMPFPYIRAEGKAGRMGARLMAIVAEGNRKRIYLPPTDEMEEIAKSADPQGVPESDLPEKALGFRVQEYGMTKHRDLFTPRQLVALTTFSDLVLEARVRVIADSERFGLENDGQSLESGGRGAQAYGEAISLYCGFATSHLARYGSAICPWNSANSNVAQVFGRQAIPMTWDFAESNPISGPLSIETCAGWVSASIDAVPQGPPGVSKQCDARDQVGHRGAVACTDPPYYDNIGYSDLADFFYVWLREGLREHMPGIFSTVLGPKREELIASPYRHENAAAAEDFFLTGMSEALSSMSRPAEGGSPLVFYYAFRQSETKAEGTSSTGWVAFLQAMVNSGLCIGGTWPLRTERTKGLKGSVNTLASSVVMTCRSRRTEAPVASRGDFQRLLRGELPKAIRVLEQASIAPVDMAQASIGPGMAIFSRYAEVMEADDSAMTVRTALQMINEVVDEVRGEEEADFDRETRFAVTWFEIHGFDEGPFGDAETIANPRGVSVQRVVDAGLMRSGGGKAKLHSRAEIPTDWDPLADSTLTVWECTQHLIRVLETEGEAAAAELLARIGPGAEAARTLAYRLYTHCGERVNWAEEARAYNGLVVAWPELEAMAGSGRAAASTSVREADLFSTDEEIR